MRLASFLTTEYGDQVCGTRTMLDPQAMMTILTHFQGLLAYSIHPGGVETELASKLPSNFRGMLNDRPELAGDTLVWLTKEKRAW